jgi:ribosomal protein S18 acetylase RimI-like enzyme
MTGLEATRPLAGLRQSASISCRARAAAVRNGRRACGPHPFLVAGDPPVGFAAVIELDGHWHLEQIAVHPDHGRRGIGAALLGAARAGRDGITLITFREVPWNGPWYARHGFTELPEAEWGPELLAHWRAEIDAGLHRLGPRLIMAAPRDL